MSFFSDIINKLRGNKTVKRFISPQVKVAQKYIPRVREVFRQTLPTPSNFRRQIVEPVQRVAQPIIQRQQAKQISLAQQHPTISLIKRNIPSPLKMATGQIGGKYVIRPTLRAVAQLGNQIIPNKQITNQGKVGKFVFGEQPVGNVTGRYQTNKQFIQSKGVSPKIAIPLAIAGTGAAMAGDIMPFAGGGEKTIYKGIAKSKNIGKITNLLKATGKIDESAIPTIAKKLVNVSDVNKVKSAVEETSKLFPKLVGKVGEGANVGKVELKNISNKLQGQKLPQELVSGKGNLPLNVETVSPTNLLNKNIPQKVQESQNLIKSPNLVGSYVDNSPLTLNTTGNEKAIAQDIRSAYSGAKNAQIIRGNQLSDQIVKLVPDANERMGLALFRDAGGDLNKLTHTLNDSRFAQYKPALEKAINLSDNAKQANVLLDKYYGETGKVGQQQGFLNELRDNYINRIYKAEPPKTFPQTETTRPGLPKSTGHAQGRIYNTLLDAIANGKQPATLDASQLLTVHSNEFAKTLTNNKLFTALEQTGLGSKIEGGRMAPGDVRIGNTNFAVPSWLSNGLKSIVEPNFINRIDAIRGLQKYQGLVKTIDLSISTFHHFTMAMQTLYQTKFGLELPSFAKFAKNADFNNVEQDFVKHTGMVSNIDANMDVLRKISEKQGFIGKATNLPGAKQVFQAIDKNNKFLFGTMQRWLKVMDYGKKTSGWIAKHPNATDAEITAAKRGFASEVNAAYGGLNWESLGITKSTVNLMRNLLLAPDWTYSNILLAKQALGGGTAGSAARSHLISALVGGTIVSDGLNKLLTGHHMWQNAKGHETEVEVKPGVYVSFFRGGVGDLLKWANRVQEFGLVSGTAQFAQGKLAPLTRTAIGLASNTDYLGNPITDRNKSFWENTKAELGFFGQSGAPQPFGIANVKKLAKKGRLDLVGGLLVGTGLARPGQTLQESMRGEYYNLQSQIQDANKQISSTKRKMINGQVGQSEGQKTLQDLQGKIKDWSGQLLNTNKVSAPPKTTSTNIIDNGDGTFSTLENGKVKNFNSQQEVTLYQWEKTNGDHTTINSQWSLQSDRLKRTNDINGWMKDATTYAQYLSNYAQQLDPNSSEYNSTLNKYKDLLNTIQKYRSYGGFTKPKAAKKAKISAASKQAKKDETARLARKKAAITALKNFRAKEYAKPNIPSAPSISGIKSMNQIAAELARGR